MESLSDWLTTNSWVIHLALFIAGYSLLLIGAHLLTRGLHRRRVRTLQRLFSDPADVQRILNQIPWQGETAEQLCLSFGRRLSRPPPQQGTLRILRAPHQEYIIAMRGGRVSGWQLFKS